MSTKKIAFSIALLISIVNSIAQKKSAQIEVLTKGTKTSIRGLSVVDDNVIWASGSNGTIGLSTNGGKTWKWSVVKGFEKKDFRDVEGFGPSKAIIMAVDSPAFILKTIDAGQTWKVVYENHTKGMFLDAMEFWNEQAGIVVGDPINGRLFVARTFDEGESWKEIPDNYKPIADSGEAMFASSGTNVRVLDRDEAVIVSGGLSSRIFIRNEAKRLPVLQGKETTGANSIAVLDVNSLKGGKTMSVVGGDFMTPDSTRLNCFYSHDRGKTWTAPKSPPHGYRSCVEYLSKKVLITCGINGVDYSSDGGATWKWISKEGFHVVRKAKNGNAVFLAGPNGKIGKMVVK
jgi:photosystem II stability/assembly factor-like uncharacterized protein